MSSDQQDSESKSASIETVGGTKSPVSENSLSLATLCIHAGAAPDPHTGAVIPPLCRSSTFEQKKPGEMVGKWDYSRAGNPTRDRLEEALAALEAAQHCITFASGLAAEHAIVSALLEAGDRVIVCDDVYGGTGRLFRSFHKDKRFDYIDMTDIQAVEKLMSEGDKSKGSAINMIWIETPTNPTLKEIDINQLSQMAQAHGALVVVDNTFATPIHQQPLTIGADIVIHSTTKYLGGHSDIVGGAVMVNSEALHEKLRFVQFGAGAVSSPVDCELLHRSLKTLDVRMERHQKNATQLYGFLKQHPYIEKASYPGFSGMIAITLKGPYEGVLHFLDQLKLFTLAESLGGVESLINHPEKMTHASVPPEERVKLGIGSNLLRLSVGIESADDLQADLERALNSCQSRFA